jgi:hypothetical protein
MVFGCTLSDGTILDTKDDNIVTIRVHPDKRVEVTRPGNIIDYYDNWISYVPRFN